MDPFTQRLLQKTKERRERIAKEKLDYSNSNLSKVRSNEAEKEILHDKKLPMNSECSFNKENYSSNAPTIFHIFEEQPEATNVNNTGKSKLQDSTKKRLKKLGEMYGSSSEDVSSPLPPSNGRIQFEEKECNDNMLDKQAGRKARLAALTKDINNWEDATKFKNDFSRGNTNNTKKQLYVSSPCKAKDLKYLEKHDNENNNNEPKKTIKKIKWDQKIIDTLEAQGFSPSISKSNLMYKFINSDKDIQTKEEKSQKSEVVLEKQKSVTDVIRQFQNGCLNESEKDPAELSLAERVAMFENIGLQKKIGKDFTPKPLPQATKIISSKSNYLTSPLKKTPEDENTTNVQNSYAQNINLKVDYCEDLNEMQNKNERSETNYLDSIIPPPPPLPPDLLLSSPSSTENIREVASNEKSHTWSPRIKPGMIYPSLSDLDTTDEDDASENSFKKLNTSIGIGDFIKSVIPDMPILSPLIQEKSLIRSSTMPHNHHTFSPVLSKFKKYLSLPSIVIVENEHNFQVNNSPEEKSQLAHSISFYRRYQNEELAASPVKKIIRNAQIHSSLPKENLDINQLNMRLKILQEAQNIMSQTATALDLCRNTTEFFGSLEQVEGERVLLVATEKHRAYASEMQRLRHDANLGNTQYYLSEGSVTFSDIHLPLKSEFLTHVTKKQDDYIHYFICLIRYRDQLTPTQMVSTEGGIQQGALVFPNMISVHELTHGFDIQFEVYAVETKREHLAPEIKYHICKDSNKFKLTPMKSLKKSSSGPQNSKRVSGFGLVGLLHINVDTLKNSNWVLDKVPPFSPLNGTLKMRVQAHAELHVEEKGFLTMFEDVSGFGAWHRRWFTLHGILMTYWKYPDDEMRKEPLGVIDLRCCKTRETHPVSRNICARPNTFLLTVVLPSSSMHQNNLIMTCYSDHTELKYLLSADTKEECTHWCSQLNKILNNVYAWDTNAALCSTKSSSMPI